MFKPRAQKLVVGLLAGLLVSSGTVASEAAASAPSASRPAEKAAAALAGRDPSPKSASARWERPEVTVENNQRSDKVHQGAGGRQELVDLRTSHMKVFAGDRPGERVAQVSRSPQHFRGSDGRWQDIDMRFRPGPGGTVRTGANSFSIKVNDAATSGGMATVVIDESHSVSFGLVGGSGQRREPDGSTSVIFRDVAKNAALRLESRPLGLKEDIILAGPDAPNRYVFPLQLEGLTAQLDESGGVVYFDGAGVVRARTHPGFMEDAAVDPHTGDGAISRGVTYRLIRHGRGTALEVTLDRAWLQDPARRWPVVADPPVEVRTGLDDTSVQDGWQYGWDASGDDELKVGKYDDPEDGIHTARSFLHFDLSGIGNVTSATLNLHEIWAWSCQEREMLVRRVTTPWQGHLVKNWVNDMPGYDQAAVLGQRTFAYGYTPGNCAPRNVPTWVGIDLDVATVQGWASGTVPNFGMMLMSNAPESDVYGWKKFDSANTAQAPYLTVSYGVNSPPYVPDQLNDGTGTYTASMPPLTARYSDPDGDAGALFFSVTDPNNHLYVNQQRVPADPAAWLTSGSSGTLPSPPAGPEGEYHWSVYARSKDGQYAGSAAESFVLDSSAPAATQLTSSTHPISGECYPNRTFAFTPAASDPSGISGYSYVLSDSATVSESVPDEFSEGAGPSFLIPDIADGSWYLHLKSRDNAGRWSAPINPAYHVKVDSTMPDPPTNAHPDPAIDVRENDVTFKWDAASDAGCGLRGYSYLFTQDSTAEPDDQVEGDAADRVVSASLGDGTWYFKVRAVDNAGLLSSLATYGPFAIASDLPYISKTANAAQVGMGQLITYELTVRSISASTITVSEISDYLNVEKGLELVPGTLRVLGDTATCLNSLTWWCVESPDGIELHDLPLPAGATRQVVFQAMAVGRDLSCSMLANQAALQWGLATTLSEVVSTKVCETGLGLEPWWSFVTKALGPMGQAHANVANGNLVVTQTDSEPVPSHGDFAYVLRRVYNSGEAFKPAPVTGAPAALQRLGADVGDGWQLNVGDLGEGSDSTLGPLGLQVPDVATAAGAPVVYVDRDGTRHVFRPKGLATFNVTTPLTGMGAALNPRVLGVGLADAQTAIRSQPGNAGMNVSVCVDQLYQAPPGVHLSMWRYLRVVSTSASPCANPAALNGEILGYGAIRPDRVRYEFAWNGQLLSMVDAAGVELRYVYDLIDAYNPSVISPAAAAAVDALQIPLLAMDGAPPAGSSLAPVGKLRWVYEPRSCPGTLLGQILGSSSDCRRFQFRYDGETNTSDHEECATDQPGVGRSVCVDDPAGRETSYQIDSEGRLTVVRNPDTSTLQYGYGCHGVTDLLCETTNGAGQKVRFEYDLDPNAGWTGGAGVAPDAPAGSGPRLAAIRDRRWTSDSQTPDSITRFAPSEAAEYVHVTQGAHQTVYSEVDRHGRYFEVQDLDVSDPANKKTLRWAQYDWGDCDFGPSPASRWPDLFYDDDNTLCGVSQARLQAPTFAWDSTEYLYSGEGARLVQARWHPDGDRATTYGQYVQHFQANGTVACTDWRTTGAGTVTTPGCATPSNNSTVFTLSDHTSTLPPRGNAPGLTASQVLAFQTTLVRDIPVLGASPYPSPSVALADGTVVCDPAAPTARKNTGLVCEEQAPPFDQASPTVRAVTRHTYDHFGQRISTTTPQVIQEGASAVAGSACPTHASAGGARLACTLYEYYPDSAPALDGAGSAGGWMKGVVDPTGKFVAFAYDRYGHRARSWDRNATAGLSLAAFPGTAASPAAPKYSQTLYADTATGAPWRWPLSDRDPLDNTTVYTVDTNGNQLTVTTPRGNQTVQTFDEAGLLKTRLTPEDAALSASNTWQHSYDAFDNLVSVKDPAGNVTKHVYDAVNRQVETRWNRRPLLEDVTDGRGCRPRIDSDAPIPADVTVCFTVTAYDGADNIIAAQDANGSTTTLEHDSLGRTVKVTVPRSASQNVITVNEYDRDGNITGVCLPRHFPAGTEACTNTATDLHRENRAYDYAGRLVSATRYRELSGGTRVPLVTRMAYDADGNLLRRDDPDDPAVTTDDRYTLFDYDVLGRKVAEQTTRAPGNLVQTTWAHDPAGNVTRVTLPGDGRVTSYEYDPLNRPLRTIEGDDLTNGVADPDGGKNTRTGVAYDQDGNVVARYEPRAFAASVTDPDERFMVRTDYDRNGRPVAQWAPRATGSGSYADTDPLAPQSSDCPAIDSALYPLHRPATVPGVGAYPDGLLVCLSTAKYDLAGRVSTLVLPTAGWDRSAGQPSAPHDQDRRIDYTYTGDGLLAAESAPDPSAAPTVQGSRVETRYSYSGKGETERVARPGGRVDTTTYTRDGLVATTTGQATATLAHVTEMAYDLAGNRTQVEQDYDGGTKTQREQWSYTPDNLLLEHTLGIAKPEVTSYRYDPVGNPLSVTSPAANACEASNCVPGTGKGAPVTNTYTLDNLLATTRTPVANDGSTHRVTSYAYDPGGRKTSQSTWTETATTDVTTVGSPDTDGLNSARASISLDRPASSIAGDLLVAAIAINDDDPAFTTPTGWSTLPAQTINDGLRLSIFYKFVAVNEQATTYTWNLSGSSTRRIAGVLTTYRGADPNNPVEASQATVDTSADTAIDAVGVAGTNRGALLHLSATEAEGTVTAPAGMTGGQAASSNSSNTRDVIAAFFTTALTATGTTAAKTATGPSSRHIAYAVTIRPAATAPAPSGGEAQYLAATFNTSGDASANQLQLNVPAGAGPDHVLVAQIALNDDEEVTIAPPAGYGWEAINSATIHDTITQAIYVKKVAAGDPTSYTFGLSGYRRVAGGMAAFKDVDLTDPTDVAGPTVASSGTALTSPQITAPAGAFLLHLTAVNAEGTITPPSGMDGRWVQAAPNSTNTRDLLVAGATMAGGPAGTKGPYQGTSQNSGASLTSIVAVKPAPAALPAGATTQTFTYYQNDRLATETGRTSEVIRHHYDPAGNQTVLDDGAGPAEDVTASYYLDGLVRTVNRGTTDTARYSYDGAGQVISRSDGTDQAATYRTQYTYGDAGLLTGQAATPQPGQWSWTYDQAGRPALETTPNGTIERRWAADDTLTSQSLTTGQSPTTSGVVKAEWTYQYDELYRQKSQTFHGKDATPSANPFNFSHTAGYEDSGRLDWFNDGTTTQQLEWDRDGNRLGYGPAAVSCPTGTTDPATTCFNYRADGSIATTKTGTTTKTFEYRVFGGLLSDGTSCHVYDGFDRLTEVHPIGANPNCSDQGAATSTYQYDQLDRQTSRTADNKTTTFRYDGLDPTVTVERVDGTDLNYVLNPAGAPLAAINHTASPDIEMLTSDGHGNIATITRPTGEVDCAVRYDPFGNPLDTTSADNPCKTGTLPASHAFYRAGQRDPKTGAYQLGSRTYDPRKGAFLTPDTYRAGPSAANLSIHTDPLTRNTYAYVNGDPVNLFDPDGHAMRTVRCADAGDGHLNCPAKATKDGVSGNRKEARKVGGRTTYYGPFGPTKVVEGNKEYFFQTRGDTSVLTGMTIDGQYQSREFVRGRGTPGGVLNILGIVFDLADLGSCGVTTITDGLHAAGGACMGAIPFIGAIKNVKNLDEINDAKKAVQEYDIVPYRPTTTPLQNHHGILDVWAKNNVEGYVSRAADNPTMALTKAHHDAATDVYKQWLKQKTGRAVGGKVDWTLVSPQEMQGLANRMFAAAGAPPEAMQAYYQALNRYIYGSTP